MRPSSGIFALPPELCEQLLALPLSADERNEVAQALLQFTALPETCAICRSAMKNAPQPEQLRGV
ncbi:MULTISPECIES: hypothetical protein [Paracoccus]|uniref:Uncharacterized protein n=1 Tax=Paracoccus fontiphilus TaxID=1815556 RepID=A0ABV7IIC8_9RHOB|nr:hypothetical protein [Paracoccus fontiphilus]